MADRRDRLPLAGLLVANAVSIAGNAFTLFAIPLFVLETTGSATKTGIAAGVSTLPIVLSAAFSGTLADRLGHRRTSILSDLASAAIVAVLPLLHRTVGIEYWHILGLVFLRSFFATPGETARGAMLPELTERAGTSLERATGAYDAVSRGARMVGYPVAGVLIAVLGAPNMLVVDAATFVVSALIVARFVPAPPRPERERSPYLRDLREGLAYLREDATVRSIVLMCMATNMLDAGFGGVMLPVYAENVLQDRRALGIVVGVAGGAALAGAVGFGAIGQRLPRRATFFAAFLICGPPRFFVLAAGGTLPALVVISLVSGIFAGALNPIMDTAIFDRVPAALRARVWGVVIAGCSAAIPVGGVLAGLAVEQLGLTRSFVVFGTTYLLVTLAPLVGSSWSGLERRPVVAPAGASVEVPEPRLDVEVSATGLGDGGAFRVEP